MMDWIYSAALLMALLAGGLGATTGVFLLLRRWPEPMGSRARWVRMSGWAALAFGATSGLIHLFFGHRPGTPEQLGVWAFLAAHPAYGVVFALVMVAWLAVRSAAGRT